LFISGWSAFPAWGSMHVEHGFDEVFEDAELATLHVFHDI